MSQLLPDLLINFTAELAASLAMAALGWAGQAWQPTPEATALQHSYATGVAAMLQTFPIQNDVEHQHYQSLLEAFFAREAVRTELVKLVQPNQAPATQVLITELEDALYTPTMPEFDPAAAICALLQGFASGAYDAEEFRSRLTLKQLVQIGQQGVQQTQVLQSMAADLRRLSQQMMSVTFVPTAPPQNRVAKAGATGTTVAPALRVHLNHLNEQIQAGRVALFVGAGVSREAGLPSGWELAEMLADELSYTPQPGDSLGTIAEYYERELSRPALIDRLVRWLDEDAQPGPSHELIPQLRWQAIYTTNYDQLLERGYEIHHHSFDRVLYNHQLQDLSRVAMPIIKLHGCLSPAHRRSEEAPIVVSDLDYEKYGPRREALIHKLKQSLLEGNTLLFLGYGLRDPFWQELRRDVATILQ